MLCVRWGKHQLLRTVNQIVTPSMGQQKQSTDRPTDQNADDSPQLSCNTVYQTFI